MATKKAKQKFIPGTAPPHIPAVETAAEEFVDARNAWQLAHQPMMDSKAELQALMVEHGLTTYELNIEGVDHIVALDQSESVSVKRKKPSKENGHLEG